MSGCSRNWRGQEPRLIHSRSEGQSETEIVTGIGTEIANATGHGIAIQIADTGETGIASGAADASLSIARSHRDTEFCLRRPGARLCRASEERVNPFFTGRHRRPPG